jgi:hypothetical protein
MRRYCVHWANRCRRERADMSCPSAQRREKISQGMYIVERHVRWSGCFRGCYGISCGLEVACPSRLGELSEQRLLMDVLLAEAGAAGRKVVVEVFRRDASGGGNLQNDRVLHLGFDRAQHNPIRDKEERGQ